jgi:hypothetical protein
MTTPILPHRPGSMTADDFLRQQESHACAACGRVGVAGIRTDPNNGGLYIYCDSCGATKHKCWPNAPAYLKQNTKTQRKDCPQTVNEVWEQWGNRCIACGQSALILRTLGFGQQRHHADPFVDHGHDGLILPICTNCHPVITALQASMRTMAKFLDNASGTASRK